MAAAIAHEMETPRMDIAIVGGGIGGLTAALYLHRAGIAVQVYESAPAIEALGVGINLFPHAVRRLTELGLEAPLSKVGIRPRRFSFYTQHGQLIHHEPAGLHAGYHWPHISVHRADLHAVLLDAVRQRLGAERIHLGHHCAGFEQSETGMTIHFKHPQTGAALRSVRTDVAVGCDGIHSAIRRQLYPGEGKPVFGGINMWRGVMRGAPFLGGDSVTRVGPLVSGKLVIYPIRNFPDGSQLLNWVAEIRREVDAPNDWHKPGRLSDFLPAYERWRFDWLDIPDMLRRSEVVLEYPMVDRDPIDRWSFGRVTLLGDAAHPMYPRGGNGGAQAIIDADVLAQMLVRHADVVEALRAYEAERAPKAAQVVRMNRSKPPDHIIELTEQRSGGKPFESLEAVLPRAELEAVLEGYRKTAAYDVAAVNGGGI